MTKTNLKNIKEAALSVKSKEDVFHIRGKDFNCEWNGNHFVWKAPSGQEYNLTAKEVMKYIGDGSSITDFAFNVTSSPVTILKDYRVYIDDEECTGQFMTCAAKNKTEARQHGRQYIKAWRLRNAKIVKIEEVEK